MGGSWHQTAGAEYSGPDSSAITEQARGRRTVPVGSRRATATSLRSLQGRTNSQRHARRMLSHAGTTTKYYHQSTSTTTTMTTASAATVAVAAAAMTPDDYCDDYYYGYDDDYYCYYYLLGGMV